MGTPLTLKIRSAFLAALILLLSACAQSGGTIPGLDPNSPDSPTADTDTTQTIPEPPSYAVFTNHYQGVGQ